jgi:hypothetical protein
MRLILAQLADGRPTAFRHVAAGVGGNLDEASVRFLLGMLVNQNVVTIRPA